jgi:hypothetical protein
MRKNKPAVPLGGESNDTGGEDERLRQHRIGHFRFQACGECDSGSGTIVDTGFIHGAIHICGDVRRFSGRKADLES